MTGRLPWRKPDRIWTYTLAAKAREEAGLQTTKEYIWQHQNTFAQYIAKQSLLDLCEGSERALGRGWGCSGGSKRALIWRGQGKRPQRRRKRMGEKSEGGEVKEESWDRASLTSTLSEVN